MCSALFSKLLSHKVTTEALLGLTFQSARETVSAKLLLWWEFTCLRVKWGVEVVFGFRVTSVDNGNLARPSSFKIATKNKK